MTPEQIAEIERIAAIFDTWADALAARDDLASQLGYGINDSFSRRLSDELQGAVDGLKALIPKA